MDNYPDGIQEGDPSMPWNQLPEPDWVGFYETIETNLPLCPDTPEEAARYVGNLIDSLKYDKRQLEKYAADGCFRRQS